MRRSDRAAHRAFPRAARRPGRRVAFAITLGARRLALLLTAAVVAVALPLLFQGTPDAIRAAQCQDGFVIWSHGQTGSMTISQTGSENLIDGGVHSNNDIRISGSDNTITGTPEYVTGFTDTGGGNAYPAPVQVVADKTPPVSFAIADYRPGGAAAVAAGTDYHPVVGALTITATEAAQGGLWYAT